MPSAAPAVRSRLTPEQLAFFNDQGYLIHPDEVFSPSQFAGLKGHFEAMLAALPPGERPENMDVPHFADPGLFRWLLDDAVLDLVEPILGPDLAVFSSHFICKPTGDGKRVPWHEDSAYWGDMLTPMKVVTVWVAIDPSTKENGCMRVIPGTHRHGYSDYDPVDDPAKNVFHIEIRKGQCDASKAVDIELAPNHASLHESRMMHGSNKNSSSVRRCGYTMRYISTRTKLHDRFEGTHQLYLARGRDHAGNRYGDPTKAYVDMVDRRHGKVKKGH